MTPAAIGAVLVLLFALGFGAERLVSSAMGPNVDMSGNCWGDGPDWLCFRGDTWGTE